MSDPYRTMAPKVIPNLNGIKPFIQAGDCYQFVYDMSTRAGHNHLRGSYLYVIESTTEAPFGEISESGLNWRCKTKHSISVWASLEQCLSRGCFVRVERIEHDLSGGLFQRRV
jgi:hypothetical protein